MEGWELGWDDGIDVGQSKTDGFTAGSLLGWIEGAPLRWPLGQLEG